MFRQVNHCILFYSLLIILLLDWTILIFIWISMSVIYFREILAVLIKFNISNPVAINSADTVKHLNCMVNTVLGVCKMVGKKHQVGV